MNIDGETKIVQDKPKFKQYLGSNPALQRILKEKLPYKEARKVIIPRKKKQFHSKTKRREANKHTLSLSLCFSSLCLSLSLSLSLCVSKHQNTETDNHWSLISLNSNIK